MILENKSIKVTPLTHGPFVVIVSEPGDDTFPIVVSPPGGFSKTTDALDYIEENFSGRKEPYLGLQFAIVPTWTPFSFIKFCSWED